MDFGFNDEYKMIQKMYRDFAEKEIKPLAEEIDENERFPKESIEKMAENEMLGIPWPEEYGGGEGDYLSYVIAVEELSKVCASTGVTLSAHTSLGSAPIYDWGTEEQKQKYLTRLASGECLGAFGLTEPNAGTDASRQKTTAVKKGDHYVLNGSKCFITNAGEAGIYVVMAMTDKEKGNHGISAFIVEDGFEGFSIGQPDLRGLHRPRGEPAGQGGRRLQGRHAHPGRWPYRHRRSGSGYRPGRSERGHCLCQDA